MAKNQNVKTDSYQRRRILLEEMEELNQALVNCSSCTGKCCTFRGNSMQITPLETYDLYFYLQNSGQWNEDLMNRLQANISEFRLDQRPSTGAGHLMRKTYTCPFFLFKSHGCPLPPDKKPYGCLAFNPFEKGVKDGEACRSRLDSLQRREREEENETNKRLKEELNLIWEKEPIPVALLDFHRAVLALKLHI